MSGTLSSILGGGGGVPVGGSALILDAPINFTQSGAEWIRTGSIKAYDSSYANAVAAAPQIRVFGNDAGSIGSSGATGSSYKFFYTGTNYSAWLAGGSTYYGSTLAICAAGTNPTGGFSTSASIIRGAHTGSYSVFPSGTANTALNYTTDGTTWTAVGGTFTTSPVKTAIVFGNNSWLALSTLSATAGEQNYIANAVPTGSWTIGASTNLGMTVVKALAYGLVAGTTATFLAVGTSSSATSGKLATTGAVGSAWTDRTSGITAFAATDSVLDAVWDGTKFIVLATGTKVYTSSDGITWTAGGAIPFDATTPSPYGGAAFASTTPQELVTDGSGTVVAFSNTSGSIRHVFFISTDHGASWNPAQYYIGKLIPSGVTSSRTFSYANSHWLENHTGPAATGAGVLDLGTSLTTPNYVGSQYNAVAGNYVRIK